MIQLLDMASPEFLQPEANEVLAKEQSRFGDVPELVKALKEDPARVIGSIEELYTDIPEHINLVEIADLSAEHVNEILAVNIQHGQETLRAVFKPEDGEAQLEKREFGVESLAKREVAAWAISDHFNLDLVPPTVYRAIDGRPGAIQLFLAPTYYRHGGIRVSEREQQIQQQGSDWKTIALFDAMIMNVERKRENWLYARNNPVSMVAIDHGFSFHENIYAAQGELRGPLLQMTAVSRVSRKGREMVARQPAVAIPVELLAKLGDGLRRKEELRTRLQPYISEDEIDVTVQRVNELADHKVFISPINYQKVVGKPLVPPNWLVK